MGTEKKKCFVIMPFTVREPDLQKYKDPYHWTEVYEGLIFPAVEKAGLDCEREDKDAGSRLVVESILTKIEKADLILCDLSSHNPNVFLELGWALRADRPYVLIKDDLTPYNFDLNTHSQFDYCHTLQPTMLREKIEELAGTILQTIKDKERRYSLTKQLAISSRAIKEAEAGDINTQLLMSIKQDVEELKKGREIENDEKKKRISSLADYFGREDEGLGKYASALMYGQVNKPTLLGGDVLDNSEIKNK